MKICKKKGNYPIHNSIKNKEIARNKFNQRKDQPNENHKTLLKEIKEETNKRKDIEFHVNRLGELILLKCPCYPKPSIVLR